MLKSYVYMFKEQSFWKKFLMLFAFVLTANFLTNLAGIFAEVLGKYSIWYNLVLILGYIVMFVPYGYSMAMLKSNIENTENTNILDMNVLQNFKAGFKVVVSGLILIFLVSLLIMILILFNRLLYTQFGITAASFIFTFVFLIFLIISFLMISMCCRYVIKPSWLNFVNLKQACQLINYDVPRYFKVYLLTVVTFILLAVVTILLTIVLTQIGLTGFILYNIAVSLIWTYLTFVFAKLFAHAVINEKI